MNFLTRWLLLFFLTNFGHILAFLTRQATLSETETKEKLERYGLKYIVKYSKFYTASP